MVGFVAVSLLFREYINWVFVFVGVRFCFCLALDIAEERNFCRDDE